MPRSVNAYAKQSKEADVAPFEIARRDVRPDDVRIEIKWTGICGSDLHQGRNDWGSTVYPIVPGHEIIGVAAEVGKDVKDIHPGDYVAVGCLVNSCRDCIECFEDHEQFCEKQRVSTYNGVDVDGSRTYGGYSEEVVVDRHCVIKVPETLSASPEKLAASAPIACAGITTWVPLRQFNIGPGKKVAVVGLGGLGHMGIKLALALGAEVSLVTRSHSKDAVAEELGVTHVISSSDKKEMQENYKKFDLVLDTIPSDHDINEYLKLATSFGALSLVGHIGPLESPPVHSRSLLSGNKILSGSNIGGIRETQELYDFCGEHDITADVEIVRMRDVNDAWQRLDKSDVKFRFVIDIDEFRTSKNKS